MSTQPNKFQPGQKVKVTGNRFEGFRKPYHSYKVGETVTIMGYNVEDDAWDCTDENNVLRTVLPDHLQPLNHE